MLNSNEFNVSHLKVMVLKFNKFSVCSGLSRASLSLDWSSLLERRLKSVLKVLVFLMFSARLRKCHFGSKDQVEYALEISNNKINLEVRESWPQNAENVLLSVRWIQHPSMLRTRHYLSRLVTGRGKYDKSLWLQKRIFDKMHFLHFLCVVHCINKIQKKKKLAIAVNHSEGSRSALLAQYIINRNNRGNRKRKFRRTVDRCPAGGFLKLEFGKFNEFFKPNCQPLFLWATI